MLYSLLIFALFFCNYGKPAKFGDNTSDVGIAVDGQFPYQVSFQRCKRCMPHSCTGTIISKYLILTANMDYCNFKGALATVGMHNINDKHKHSTYNVTSDDVIIGTDKNGEGGIHVYRVQGEIKFSDRVQPIKVASKEVAPGTIAVLSGWKRSVMTTESSLRYINYTVMSNEECRKAIKNFPDNNICTANGREALEFCINDVGAPLVANGEQIGLTHYLVLCDRLYHVKYIDLHYYYREISKLITDEDVAREKQKEEMAKEEEERKKKEEEERRKKEEEEGKNSAVQSMTPLPVAFLTALSLLGLNTL